MKNYFFIKNQRKNDNIISNGYMYNKDNRTDALNKWRCSYRKCKVVGCIGDDDVFTFTGQHLDKQNLEKMNVKTKMCELNKEILTTHKIPLKIVTDITKTISDESVRYLPKFKTMIDSVNKKRNKLLEKYDVLNDDIPELYHFDLTGDKFLLHDEGVESKNRYVIFMSHSNFNYLKNADSVLVDGTFWSVPSNFFQLITINVHLFGRFFPVCFILFVNKTEYSYVNAFTKLKELTICNFRNIIIDFEMALKNAIMKVFVCANVFGCTFHFGKSVLEKLKKLHMYDEYCSHDAFRDLIRNLLNLVFVPEKRVLTEYNKIKENIKNLNETYYNCFIDYFEKTYVGMNNTFPIFKISFWNAYSRVLNNTPRTTNCSEAWHRVLNFRCNVSHPNFAKFMEILLQENEKARIGIIQGRLKIDIGSKNVVKEEFLRQVIVNYYFYNDDEFFKNLSKIVGWKSISKF